MTDIEYVVDLARRETEAIGFIPRPRLEAYHARGQLYVGRENGEPCGFLLFGAGWPALRVYQACVQYDARRREHGAALAASAEAEALRRGCEAVSLWCAEDLEANGFWRACGFRLAGTKPGGRRRGRILNRWEKRLEAPLQPALAGEEERSER